MTADQVRSVATALAKAMYEATVAGAHVEPFEKISAWQHQQMVRTAGTYIAAYALVDTQISEERAAPLLAESAWNMRGHNVEWASIDKHMRDLHLSYANVALGFLDEFGGL